jgi:flagellar L-ring protein precursor FlgH
MKLRTIAEWPVAKWPVAKWGVAKWSVAKSWWRARPARIALAVLGLAAAFAAPARAQTNEQELNRYIEDSLRVIRQKGPASGSLYVSTGFLGEVSRDPKAAQVGDLVTVQIVEQASALTSGATAQSRASSADNAITRFLGIPGVSGPLANLLQSSGDSSLQGQGSTSRQTSVTAVLTTHVTHVMPNGNIIIEGGKEIAVNSERQVVWLRGVVRPADLSPENSVASSRIALMDLRVNGRGVVNDAIRRPNILYRILQKILPF